VPPFGGLVCQFAKTCIGHLGLLEPRALRISYLLAVVSVGLALLPAFHRRLPSCQLDPAQFGFQQSWAGPGIVLGFSEHVRLVLRRKNGERLMKQEDLHAQVTEALYARIPG
jgi:hypothetical protein